MPEPEQVNLETSLEEAGYLPDDEDEEPEHGPLFYTMGTGLFLVATIAMIPLVGVAPGFIWVGVGGCLVTTVVVIALFIWEYLSGELVAGFREARRKAGGGMDV